MRVVPKFNDIDLIMKPKSELIAIIKLYDERYKELLIMYDRAMKSNIRLIGDRRTSNEYSRISD